MVTTDDLWASLRTDEVDGVPVVWAPTAGPLSATLMFRVGSADEEIPHRGLTHLLEHAALEQFASQDFDVNGVTELLHTSLFVRGRDDEVVEALAAMTEWFRHRPTEAVDGMHRDVLAAEEFDQGGAAGRQVMNLLFGTGSHGRAGLPEYGLPSLGPEDAASWSARFFTSENARLVLSGPPPVGLRLDLPPGALQPAPAVPSPVLDLPAWQEQSQGACTVATLTRRGAVASMADEVLAAAAAGLLRHEAGDVYGVHGQRLVLGLEGERSALSILGFGLRPERWSKGTQAFIELLDGMTAGVVDRELLQRLQRRRRRANEEPTAAIGLAHNWAREELLGDRGQFATFLDEQYQVTVEDLVDEFRRRRDDLLVVAPTPPVERSGPGWSPVAAWSDHSVDGEVYRPIAGVAAGIELRAAPDGLTLVGTERGDVVTIMFDACEAMLRWDEGTRLLLGASGFQIFLRSEVWPDLEVLGPWLDDRVRSRVLDMGAPTWERDERADESPTTSATAHHPAWAELTTRLLAPPAVAVLGFCFYILDDSLQPQDMVDAAVTTLLVAAVVSMCWAAGWWFTTGRHRRRAGTD